MFKHAHSIIFDCPSHVSDSLLILWLKGESGGLSLWCVCQWLVVKYNDTDMNVIFD